MKKNDVSMIRQIEKDSLIEMTPIVLYQPIKNWGGLCLPPPRDFNFWPKTLGTTLLYRQC